MLQPHILGRLKEPHEELDLMSAEGKELPVLRQGCIEWEGCGVLGNPF